MLKNWKSQRGYTGIDIVLSAMILLVFTLIISTIFINIYLQYSDGQRNAAASSYLSSIAETIDKMYYQDITNENLAQIISQMRFANGYTATATVERYIPEGKTEENSIDLVKNITIEISYNIGGNAKKLKIEKIKAKELLITPNAPKISSNMVPVKYIVTDINSNEGYYQITSENDSTWYNYDNKVWATMMLTDGLIAEGNIVVNDSVKADLVGKKIISTDYKIFTWIPKFSKSTQDVIFLYSTSEKYVDSNGNLQEKGNEYTTSDSFENITGFWVAMYDYEVDAILTIFDKNANINNIEENQEQAVIDLSTSKYGTNSVNFQNIGHYRKIITVE